MKLLALILSWFLLCGFSYRPYRAGYIDWTHPLSRHLIGFWVPDAAGNAAFDYSGNGFHGTLSAGTIASLSATDREGDVFFFSGTGSQDNILIGTGPSKLLGNSSMTLIVRAARSNVTADGALLGNYTSAGPNNNEVLFFYDDAVGPFGDSDRVSFTITAPSAGSTWPWAESTQEFGVGQIGVYFTIAGVYDRGKSIKVYVDGVDDTDQTQNDTVTFSGTPPGTFRMGTTPDNTSTRELQGGISYAFLFREALTGPQIKSLYDDPWQMFYVPMDFTALVMEVIGAEVPVQAFPFNPFSSPIFNGRSIR